jgi:hypothetical protein
MPKASSAHERHSHLRQDYPMAPLLMAHFMSQLQHVMGSVTHMPSLLLE